MALRGVSDLDLTLVIHNFPEWTTGKQRAAHDKRILESIILALDSEKIFSELFTTESANIITTSFGY